MPHALDTTLVKLLTGLCSVADTVNPEIFARVYFREISHMRSFVKIKSSRNEEIILSFTDIGIS